MRKNAFTLIELLIVVLIVGILATVALPQYQKAILKSRITEAWVNLGFIRKAVILDRTENGEVSNSGNIDPQGIQGSLNPGFDILGIDDPNDNSGLFYYYSRGMDATIGGHLIPGDNLTNIAIIAYYPRGPFVSTHVESCKIIAVLYEDGSREWRLGGPGSSWQSD